MLNYSSACVAPVCVCKPALSDNRLQRCSVFRVKVKHLIDTFKHFIEHSTDLLWHSCCILGLMMDSLNNISAAESEFSVNHGLEGAEMIIKNEHELHLCRGEF